MAVAEHPYYGSFGYHVSNFFAASSRFGTPEELKELIGTAHEMGILVIMDLVHSHTVKNTYEGMYLFDGSEDQYLIGGKEGHHPQWDSKLFNYGKIETLRLLLSNVRYWLEEYAFFTTHFPSPFITLLGAGTIFNWPSHKPVKIFPSTKAIEIRIFFMVLYG